MRSNQLFSQIIYGGSYLNNKSAQKAPIIKLQCKIFYLEVVTNSKHKLSTQNSISCLIGIGIKT